MRRLPIPLQAALEANPPAVFVALDTCFAALLSASPAAALGQAWQLAASLQLEVAAGGGRLAALPDAACCALLVLCKSMLQQLAVTLSHPPLAACAVPGCDEGAQRSSDALAQRVLLAAAARSLCSDAWLLKHGCVRPGLHGVLRLPSSPLQHSWVPCTALPQCSPRSRQPPQGWSWLRPTGSARGPAASGAAWTAGCPLGPQCSRPTPAHTACCQQARWSLGWRRPRGWCSQPKRRSGRQHSCRAGGRAAGCSGRQTASVRRWRAWRCCGSPAGRGWAWTSSRCRWPSLRRA